MRMTMNGFNETYVASPIEQSYIDNPGLYLGPWLVGALFDFFFAVSEPVFEEVFPNSKNLNRNSFFF